MVQRSFFLILLLLCNIGFAQNSEPAQVETQETKKPEEKKLLAIVPPKLPFVKDDRRVEEIHKDMLLILMQDPRYQIIFGDSKDLDPSRQILQLETEVLQIQERFYITGRVLNLKSRAVEKTAIRNKVHANSLIFSIRLVLLELLYGKKWVDENKYRLRKEMEQGKISGKEAGAGLAEGEGKGKKSLTAGQKQKSVRDHRRGTKSLGQFKGQKKKTGQGELARGKKDGTGLGDGKQQNPNRGTEDFLLNAEEERNKKVTDTKNKKHKNKKSEIATSLSNKVDTKGKVQGPRNSELSFKQAEASGQIEVTKYYLKRSYQLSLGYMQESMTSQDQIEVQNKNRYLFAELSFRVFPKWRDKDHFHLMGLYGKSVKDDEVSIPDKKKLTVGYEFYPKDIKFSFFPFLSYETLSFINLQEIAGGLVLGKSRFLWWGACALRDFQINSKFNGTGKFEIKRVFGGATDYGEEDDPMFSGFSVGLSGEVFFNEKYGASLNYQWMKVSSSISPGLELQQHTLSLGMSYTI